MSIEKTRIETPKNKRASKPLKKLSQTADWPAPYRRYKSTEKAQVNDAQRLAIQPSGAPVKRLASS